MVVEPRAKEEGVDLSPADHTDLFEQCLEKRFARGLVAVLDHFVDVRLQGAEIVVGERAGCQNSVRVARNSRFAGRTLILAPHRDSAAQGEQ